MRGDTVSAVAAVDSIEKASDKGDRDIDAASGANGLPSETRVSRNRAGDFGTGDIDSTNRVNDFNQSGTRLAARGNRLCARGN
jgi:hypothetical protein